MKICPYCKHGNDDGAENCCECGAEIGIEKESTAPQTESIKESSDSISIATKWCLWLAAWGIVVLVNLMLHPASILSAPLFPAGLVVWLPNGEDKAVTGLMTGAWMIGWLFYLILTIFVFAAKRMRVFIIVYVIFCLLLILNVVGCEKTMEAVSQIH